MHLTIIEFVECVYWRRRTKKMATAYHWTRWSGSGTARKCHFAIFELSTRNEWMKIMNKLLLKEESQHRYFFVFKLSERFVTIFFLGCVQHAEWIMYARIPMSQCNGYEVGGYRPALPLQSILRIIISISNFWSQISEWNERNKFNCSDCVWENRKREKKIPEINIRTESDS